MPLRKVKKSLVSVGVLGLLIFVSQLSGIPVKRLLQALEVFQKPEVTVSETMRVARVVDGDTIELENGEKVRYIGVNAPESVKPNSPVECFGKEASAFNKQLVEGKTVRLEKDISERDKYGRLLRFVYLENGTFVNDVLVREGYAYASTFPPDVSKADQFKSAQQEARENNRGLWAENTCKGKK